MTSQEMMKEKCKPGYWFENVAKVGKPQNWIQVPIPHSSQGTIFDYEEKAFLNRQYK